MEGVKLKIIKTIKDLGYSFNEEEILNAINKNKLRLDITDDMNYKYKVLVYNLINGAKPLKYHNSNPYSIDNIKNFIKIKNLNLELLEDKYVSTRELMKFKCGCGSIFKMSLETFMYSKRIKAQCNKCGYSECISKRLKPREEIEQILKNKGFIWLDKKYINKKTPLNVMDKMGYKYRMYIKTLETCKITYPFKDTNPYTIENIKTYLQINKIETQLMSETFESTTKPLIWKCFCGEIFEATFTAFKHCEKTRCRRCTKVQSHGEFKVEEYLKSQNINYKKEYVFSDCKNSNSLRFDFAILNNENNVKALVEVDGRQHYEVVDFGGGNTIAKQSHEILKQNDAIKNKYCKDNNILLVRIPYWEFRGKNKDNYKRYIDKI